MIIDLKPYPKYTSIDLPWLDFLPEHWTLERGKNFMQSIDIRSETGEEELLTVSSAEGVVPRKSVKVTMFKAESYIGYKLCWPNDLVINSLWAWAGGLGISKYHGIISSAYGVYRIKDKSKCIPDFVHELVRSKSFHWELFVRSKGIWTSRLQLTDDAFLNAPFPIPPLEEQEAIVRFLGYTNNRINRFIRNKHKLIKLLIEQKKAIIHQAVTRGLNPDVPMKDSGVNWLGKIPAHWHVRRLKESVSRIQTGSWGNDPDGVNETICVRVADFDRQRRKVSLVEPTIRSVSQNDLEEKLLKKYDLLLEKSGGGDAQPVGVVILWDGDEKAVCSNFIARLSIKTETYNPLFLLYMHESLYKMRINVRSIKQTTGIQNLDVYSYFSEKVAFPPKDEQIRISEFLVKETNKFDQAIEKARNEIFLLREFKLKLISDIVVGKFDVSNIKNLNPKIQMGEYNLEDQEEYENIENVISGYSEECKEEDY